MIFLARIMCIMLKFHCKQVRGFVLMVLRMSPSFSSFLLLQSAEPLRNEVKNKKTAISYIRWQLPINNNNENIFQAYFQSGRLGNRPQRIDDPLEVNSKLT